MTGEGLGFVVAQIPEVPGGSSGQPLGLVVLVAVCVLIGWAVYRDGKQQGVSYAWQAGVAVAALVFAGLVPGILALVVYFLVLRR